MPQDSTNGQLGPRQPSFGFSSAQLLVILLMVSLSVLFGASIVAYLIIRHQNSVWRTEAMQPLPWGLVVSTLILVAMSWTLERAKRAISRNDFRLTQRQIRWSLGLGVLFVAAQGLNFRSMVPETPGVELQTLYPFTFYLLLGLHALHVVGGMVPLGLVSRNLVRQQYSSSRYEGIRLTAQYWHFLGVIWFVLMITLLIFS